MVMHYYQSRQVFSNPVSKNQLPSQRKGKGKSKAIRSPSDEILKKFPEGSVMKCLICGQDATIEWKKRDNGFFTCRRGALHSQIGSVHPIFRRNIKNTTRVGLKRFRPHDTVTSVDRTWEDKQRDDGEATIKEMDVIEFLEHDLKRRRLNPKPNGEVEVVYINEKEDDDSDRNVIIVSDEEDNKEEEKRVIKKPDEEEKSLFKIKDEKESSACEITDEEERSIRAMLDEQELDVKLEEMDIEEMSVQSNSRIMWQDAQELQISEAKEETNGILNCEHCKHPIVKETFTSTCGKRVCVYCYRISNTVGLDKDTRNSCRNPHRRSPASRCSGCWLKLEMEGLTLLQKYRKKMEFHAKEFKKMEKTHNDLLRKIRQTRKRGKLLGKNVGKKAQYL